MVSILEAHSLKQWWSSDAELDQDTYSSKLISKQLANTRICVIVSVPNDQLLGIGKSNATAANWVTENVIAHVPATNITAICVGSEDYKNDVMGKKMVDKEIKVPINEQNLFVVSKEKHKLCAARGLEQWWPTESELVHFFHNKKNIC
ncbi:hypothetical protein JHK87_018936 [Glycine soja]|nr:hypothetical protein JHK87_018936 [Glycine soja]